MPITNGLHMLKMCLVMVTVLPLINRLSVALLIPSIRDNSACDICAALGSSTSPSTGRSRSRILSCVVLDKDLFSIDANRIKDVRVLATYLGGKMVYSAD